jgi:hypothetical protein
MFGYGIVTINAILSIAFGEFLLAFKHIVINCFFAES